MDLVQVDIIGLSTSPSSGGAYALVLGEVDGSRRLPIIIGAFEAQAIALELEKIQPPRPMTHDLIRDLYDAVGGEVTDIVIDELREGTFFAKIRYTVNGSDEHLDSRPSDAVAVAVRVGAPIFVSEAVLEEAGIPIDEADELAEIESSSEEEPEEQKDEPKTDLERLQAALAKAISEENYERAASLRDEINKMIGSQN
ncbi:MAG: bifunctional nuclease family protein [Bacteroidetes bacterium]|nr:bifunctional nuclease family protein [Bacteroidota bacterium]MCH8245031.1 bifunctional nuclease family protein [Bacteroidota bacterium]